MTLKLTNLKNRNVFFELRTFLMFFGSLLPSRIEDGPHFLMKYRLICLV